VLFHLADPQLLGRSDTMSALIRVSAGAIALGLYCLPLGAVVAQNATDRAPGDVKPARSQSDAADRPGQRADSAQPGQTQPGRTTPGRQPYTANFRGTQPGAGQTQEVDQFFAGCLLAHNKAEVELSQLAQQQSQNPEVKKFAEQMIKDHSKMIQQLQPLASAQGERAGGLSQRNTSDATSATNSLGTSSTDAAQSTPGRAPALPGSPGADNTIAQSGVTGESSSTTSRSAGGSAAVQQITSIEQKIKEQCKQSAKEELQQKSGAEFDKCYIGNAISAHMQAVAALEVLGQQSQGQLAQVAQQAQPTVQKHLDHAKQLMKELEGQGSGEDNRAAARPTSDSSR
jgi:predicted outer membrane protein